MELFSWTSVYFVYIEVIAAFRIPDDVQRAFCRNERTTVVSGFAQDNNNVELCVKHGKSYIRTESVFNRECRFPEMKKLEIIDDCRLNETFEDIYMLDDDYVYLLKTNDRWLYAGFTQVWLGCQPPFCFMPTIELGLQHFNSYFIFRGHFLCQLKEVAANKHLFYPPTFLDCYEFHEPFVDSAYSIPYQKQGLQERLHFYVMKNNNSYICYCVKPCLKLHTCFADDYYRGNNKQPVFEHINWFLNHLGEHKKRIKALFFSVFHEEQWYYINGTKWYRWKFLETLSDGTPSIEMEPAAESVDVENELATPDTYYFVTNTSIYAIKRNMVYKAAVRYYDKEFHKYNNVFFNRFEAIGPVFSTLFACEDNYESAKFINYNGFEEYMKSFDDFLDKNNTRKKPRTKPTDKDIVSHGFPVVVVVASAFVFVAVLIAIVIVAFMVKTRKRSTSSSTLKSTSMKPKLKSKAHSSTLKLTSMKSKLKSNLAATKSSRSKIITKSSVKKKFSKPK